MLGSLHLINTGLNYLGFDPDTGEHVVRLDREFKCVGTFLLYFWLEVPTTQATTYLTRVIRHSTLVDPVTEEVPEDEEIFRTRHVLRRFWNTTADWIIVNVGYSNPALVHWTSGYVTSAFWWSTGNYHYYSPFVRPASWAETYERDIFTEPFARALDDPWFDPTPSTDPDDRYGPNDVNRIVKPDPIFQIVKLGEGQSIILKSACYQEDPFRDDATTPYLDDTIPDPVLGEPPSSNVSGSEVQIPWDGTAVRGWLLRI